MVRSVAGPQHKNSNGADLVLVIRVQIYTALLRALPVLGNALIDVGLVDDLGDQLWAFDDSAGVGSREFSARNDIFTAIDNEELQEGPDIVYCKAQDYDGDDEEYSNPSSHGCGVPPFFSWRTMGALKGRLDGAQAK